MYEYIHSQEKTAVVSYLFTIRHKSIQLVKQKNVGVYDHIIATVSFYRGSTISTPPNSRLRDLFGISLEEGDKTFQF